jgi:hypothetical protein
MILLGKLSESLFYFVVGSTFGNSQHLIIISFICHINFSSNTAQGLLHIFYVLAALHGQDRPEYTTAS